MTFFVEGLRLAGAGLRLARTEPLHLLTVTHKPEQYWLDMAGTLTHGWVGVTARMPLYKAVLRGHMRTCRQFSHLDRYRDQAAFLHAGSRALTMTMDILTGNTTQYESGSADPLYQKLKRRVGLREDNLILLQMLRSLYLTNILGDLRYVRAFELGQVDQVDEMSSEPVFGQGLYQLARDDIRREIGNSTQNIPSGSHVQDMVQILTNEKYGVATELSLAQAVYAREMRMLKVVKAEGDNVQAAFIDAHVQALLAAANSIKTTRQRIAVLSLYGYLVEKGQEERAESQVGGSQLVTAEVQRGLARDALTSKTESLVPGWLTYARKRAHNSGESLRELMKRRLSPGYGIMSATPAVACIDAEEALYVRALELEGDAQQQAAYITDLKLAFMFAVGRSGGSSAVLAYLTKRYKELLGENGLFQGDNEGRYELAIQDMRDPSRLWQYYMSLAENKHVGIVSSYSWMSTEDIYLQYLLGDAAPRLGYDLQAAFIQQSQVFLLRQIQTQSLADVKAIARDKYVELFGDSVLDEGHLHLAKTRVENDAALKEFLQFWERAITDDLVGYQREYSLVKYVDKQWDAIVAYASDRDPDVQLRLLNQMEDKLLAMMKAAGANHELRKYLLTKYQALVGKEPIDLATGEVQSREVSSLARGLVERGMQDALNPKAAFGRIVAMLQDSQYGVSSAHSVEEEVQIRIGEMYVCADTLGHEEQAAVIDTALWELVKAVKTVKDPKTAAVLMGLAQELMKEGILSTGKEAWYEGLVRKPATTFGGILNVMTHAAIGVGGRYNMTDTVLLLVDGMGAVLAKDGYVTEAIHDRVRNAATAKITEAYQGTSSLKLRSALSALDRKVVAITPKSGAEAMVNLVKSVSAA